MKLKILLRGVRSAISIKNSVSSDFRRAPFPLFMVWEATYRCNLRCSYCYLAGLRNSEVRILDTVEIKKIVAEAARLGLFCLVITGGEPLLRDDIYDIRAYSSGLGLLVSLTTNGTMIENSNIEEISGFDHVTISADSMHAMSYAQACGRANAHLSRLAPILKRLKKLSSGILINIQVVIDEDNWIHLLEINREFYELGVDAVFQLRYGSNFDIEKNHWDRMIRNMKFRNKILGSVQKKSLVYFPMISKGEYSSPCLALTSNFVVSPEGNLLPCNYRREKIVDLRTEKALSDIWNHLRGFRKIYSSETRGCTCANTCFLPPAMLLS